MFGNEPLSVVDCEELRASYSLIISLKSVLREKKIYRQRNLSANEKFSKPQVQTTKAIIIIINNFCCLYFVDFFIAFLKWLFNLVNILNLFEQLKIKRF